jgi:pyrroline-5-carboxylate reductase
MTAKGLAALESGGVRAAFERAVAAASGAER